MEAFIAKVPKNESVDANKYITELEIENRSLKNKVKVLRFQLDSQAHLHSTVCFCSRRTILTRSQLALKSSSMINVHNGNSVPKGAFTSNKPSNQRIHSSSQYDSITRQLHVLQQQLEFSQSRVFELEQELTQKSLIVTSPTKVKASLTENVELIKLKRTCKKQSAQLLTLEAQLQESEKELNNFRSSVNYFNEQRENLLLEFSKEKDNSTKLYGELVSAKANIKILEEQLTDIQKEKTVLKEHNDNLLKLSLQTETRDIPDDSNKFLQQIRELEDDLRKETITKSGLSSKLADMELLITKTKNETIQQSGIILDLQKQNVTLQEECTRLKESRRKRPASSKHRRVEVLKENKSANTETDWLIKKNTASESPNNKLDDQENFINRNNIPSMNVKLSDALKELNQCKELLQTQYGLNNKYKQEVEELQRIFNETSEKMHSYAELLINTIVGHTKEIRNVLNSGNITNDYKIILENIVTTLENIKQTDSIENHLKIMIEILKCYRSLGVPLEIQRVVHCKTYDTVGTNTISNDVCDVTTETVIENNVRIDAPKEIYSERKSRSDRRGSYVIENNDRNDDNNEKNVIQPTTDIDNRECTNVDSAVEFEICIEKIKFEQFPDYLRQKIINNQKPSTFITWIFFNNDEHRAYTSTKPIDNAIFDCTCHYEGKLSSALINYLNKEGIHLDVYLIQGDISVKIANAIIDTSSGLTNCNEKCYYTVRLSSPNILGTIVGWFKFICDPESLSRVITI